MPRNDNNEITFEIIDELGVLGTSNTGWHKELNLVSWNGGTTKYDIRDWDPNHERMSRGITLKEAEMLKVVEIMAEKLNLDLNQSANSSCSDFNNLEGFAASNESANTELSRDNSAASEVPAS